MPLRAAMLRLAAGTLVALAGLAFAVLLGSTVVGILAATVGGAAVLYARRGNDARAAVELLGADRIATAMRMLAVLVLLAATSDALAAPVIYGLAAVGILGLWSAAHAAATGVSKLAPPMAVRNLPGSATLPRSIGDPGVASDETATLATIADLICFGLVAIAVAVGSEPLVTAAAVLVVVAAVAALIARKVLPAMRALRSGTVARNTTELVTQLSALAPQAVVHLSAGPGQSRYILSQWLPALEAMHLRAFVLVREPSHLRDVPQTSLPVVLAPTGRDVEALTVDSVRVAFYLANGELNMHLLRDARLLHVFLNHGDSDKSTSANPFSRVYDEIWVAGQAGIDRYAAAGVELDLGRFAIVGRPQVESLPVGPRAADGAVTVLYAPTFEGYFEQANYSSLERMGPALIRHLLGSRPNVRIVFKPHPSTGQQQPRFSQAKQAVEALLRAANSAGADHVIVDERPGMTLSDALAIADVLVSDISSVMTDFLWTERPVVVSNPRGLPAQRFAELFPTQRASYVLDAQLGNLDELLDAALGPDPKRQARVDMKRYVLGDLPDGPMKAFVEQADRTYAAAVERAQRITNTFTFSADEIARDR